LALKSACFSIIKGGREAPGRRGFRFACPDATRGAGSAFSLPDDAGFTFLELLTVLALMALLLGLVAPTFYRSWERERVRGSLRDLGSVLRLARSIAVTERVQTRVYVDLGQGRYWLEGKGRAGRLPAGTRVAQASLVWPERGRELGYIAFYADGASSGARLALEGPGGRSYMVQVDNITGKVTLGAAG
jgi:prepilin-type N-terminal cleavage/methylation domain-containing protein